MKNQLLKIFEAFPDREWNWSHLSMNPCIDCEFVMYGNNIDRINWYYLTFNPNLTREFISLFLDRLYPEIAKHPSVDISFIMDHPEHKWDWYFVSENPNITCDFIEEHMYTKNLNWNAILIHPNVPISFLEKHKNFIFSKKRFMWYHATQNPNMTIEFIMNHLYYEWNESDVSEYVRITCDDIRKYRSIFRWDYKACTRNKSITLRDIFQNMDIKWDMRQISRNPNITFQDHIEHIEFVEFVVPDKIKDIPDNFVEYFLKRSSYDDLTKNVFVDVRFFLERRDWMWNWSQISMNRTLRAEHVIEYPDLDWDFDAMSRNVFDSDTCMKIARKTCVMSDIHNELIQKTWHPSRFIDWCYDEDNKKEVNEIFL
jgi:hypothetical protein